MVYNHSRTQNVVLTLFYWKLKRWAGCDFAFLGLALPYSIGNWNTIFCNSSWVNIGNLPYSIGNWNQRMNVLRECGICTTLPYSIGNWNAGFCVRRLNLADFSYLILLEIETRLQQKIHAELPQNLPYPIGDWNEWTFGSMQYGHALLTLSYWKLKLFALDAI